MVAERIISHMARNIMLFLGILIPATTFNAEAQEASESYFYRIYFTDKGTRSITSYDPAKLLSERAIKRRQKSGISFPDFRDIPVNIEYINQITAAGLRLHSTSRWMNTALFVSIRPDEIERLEDLSFVKEARIVKKPTGKGTSIDKNKVITTISDPGDYKNPLTMLKGDSLHYAGFKGKNILVAVLDGGFTNAGTAGSLYALRDRNGIKGTYDFVKRSSFVFDYAGHGTAVLSILAGETEGLIEGSAPDADYLLLRTEDPETEFAAEEDFWTAGAEYADSAGADIITASLGYFRFDDPAMNYAFSDIDGNTTFVTQAADIAAAKGILVVSSAGNERESEWIHIIAPSDGDSVLAVGAVDEYGGIASFSSAGPSFDRRIKPDVAAQGVNIPLQYDTETIERSSGTSFSCPVISGLCACIMQAVPEATNTDIISAIHFASDRYSRPDSLYGYGIPDMVKVVKRLQETVVAIPEDKPVAWPNPFNKEINVIFRDIPEQLIFEIYTNTGRLIFRKTFSGYISRSVRIDGLSSLAAGLYIIRLVTPGATTMHKVIKVSN